MKPAALFSLVAMVAMSSGVAWSAETASNPADRTVIAERTFGDVHFVFGEGKARKWLEMYVGGAYVAGFSDFLVDGIVAAPDGKHFLVLSNSSKSSYAYAIVDRKGLIEASLPHGGNLHYCNRTSWGVGEWVDTMKPQATFSMQMNQMTTPATQYLQATVRGCDGRTVIVARAPAPSLKTTPAATATHSGISVAIENGEDRGSFFIGNTIANLRDLDPTFGARTLTLVDGRRVASPPSSAVTIKGTAFPPSPAVTFKSTALLMPAGWTGLPVSERRTCQRTGSCSNSLDLVVNRADGSLQILATGLAGHFIALPGARRVFDCAESTGVVEPRNPVPAIFDLDGNTTFLPPHPGPLHVCTRTGTGDEVMLTYTMAEAGQRFTLARVFNATGTMLAEKNFDKAGTMQFSVAGQTYSEAVPGP